MGSFDVVVAGGSTAAYTAALAAAEAGARTALLEPTDWIGGQLTSSGVPAVDEAWHKVLVPGSDEVHVNVATVARDPANMNQRFRSMLMAVRDAKRCWVSRFCFEPEQFLRQYLEPLQAQSGDRLVVFHDTVVKKVETRGDRIVSITAIRRMPRADVAYAGYDRPLSEDLLDWYSAEPSPRFDKRVLHFAADGHAVFIDATEWGELLVLADAPYLQGTDEAGQPINDQCGQCISYDFVQELHAEAVTDSAPEPQVGHLGLGMYRDRADAWEKIWTYRRIRCRALEPAIGDLSLQNWGYSVERQEGGNDYPFGYVFLNIAESADQVADWAGGVNLAVLRAAEDRAFAWHHWFKNAAPPTITPERINMSVGTLGTGHGLAKMPYIRDTRRSVGLDGFVLRFADLTAEYPARTGTRFDDRIAIGAYAADIHPLCDCQYPEFGALEKTTLPFYIPFRALTNHHYGNLLVAGKTMAQSFLANSATRLHPIEWNTGIAAGLAAALMADQRLTTRAMYQEIGQLQEEISRQTPIDWTFPRGE